MPNYGPKPPPFGQPPPFSQSTPSAGLRSVSQQMSRPGPPPPVLSRPEAPPSGSFPSTVPPNMPPVRSTGPLGSQALPSAPRTAPLRSFHPSSGTLVVPHSGFPSSSDFQSSGFSDGAMIAPMPPPVARPSFMSSSPSAGSQVRLPWPATLGPVSNGPSALGGPQFPQASNAQQQHIVSPTKLESAQTLRRLSMHSVRGSPAVAPAGAPMQLQSQFSAAPQDIPPFQSSAYGSQAWPMQPQQVALPPAALSAAQPPMFGMPPPPPPLPSQLTTISPTVGQDGIPRGGQSKVDPSQIPRPDPSSSVIMYETRHGNQANPPPPATSDFIAMDTGNCSPRYMRCTINQVPCTADLLATSGMQLALLVQPLALPHPSEEPVQIVDFGESGPIRCSRCKGYINPFMKFIDQGRHFICNLCGFIDETPRDYHCNLGPDGLRRDADERPELCKGTVEFVASKEYMVCDPMPAVYFFLIDVSMSAIQTGAAAAACSAINQVISDLPTLMLIVTDVEDVYIPLQTDVIFELSECRQHLELLLGHIPMMFQKNKTLESAFGAAIKAGFLAMKGTGGKLLVFQSVLPSAGVGALPSRELEGRTNVSVGEKGVPKLLQAADKTLRTMAIEFAGYQVCIDVFITSQTYVDVASVSVIPRTTGGQVYYYYPFSTLSDTAKLYNDLRWNITRPQGFEAVMRVRCSQGIQVQEYYGNFCKRIPTNVDLPGFDCDKSILVTLKHDDKLQDGSECAFQSALLYTTVYGQRRIRVTNLSLPCSNMLSNLFRSADLDTQFACFLKKEVLEIPSRPLLHVRGQVTSFCINILVSYRKFCATVSSPGQLILPESLMFLPLYTLALLKSIGFQADGRIDDRAYWINRAFSLSLPSTIALVFPRMVPIHELNPKENESLIPPRIPLTTENLSEKGIYLLENGEDCLIYIGNLVDSDILQQLFGISSVDEIPTQFVLQQYDNPISKKLNDVINEIRRQRCSYIRLKLCKKGDASGLLFFSCLVEDKNSRGPSYVEFLAQIHRDIQSKISY
ncbi:protein transport protein Sec24-like At4g32640 isoform X3 [Mangifera indica]|uniref:protein transport protein Sec24-like At4g32640 isoform X3 n=1 Tax=Mangifera indica TaxID=29780 RepID=UPI001CFA36B1|nr:protein transport protein Sec24-like At4g32640 isoform X3 [Mangifera indica]